MPSRSTTAFALTALICTISGSAHANGEVTGVKVTKVAINNNVVFVKTDAASVPGTPSCSVNGYWHFAYSASMQTMTAILLNARISGLPVDLGGLGNCSSFYSIEELGSIHM
jgi:hypothetical protein